MMRPPDRPRPARRGTVLPMLGVCLIGLFAFVALAVDLGMLAVNRCQCQNAADVAALVGCRTLDNKNPTDASYDNNRPQALDYARTAATSSALMGNNLTTAQVQSVTAGTYDYDTTSQTFTVSYPASLTSGKSWTAIEVVVNVAQPTYFMKVWGVNSMPSGARAVAVHRPRDTAFVLDMTGSMRFGTTMNQSGKSLNPDPLVPAFGHYVSAQSSLVASANETNSSGEAISRNNYTITTPGGPPLIRDFYFDPVNVGNPATPAYPVTASTANLVNAFHRWVGTRKPSTVPPYVVTPPAPPESGGNSSTYTPVTYDFTGYNAFHNGTETDPKGPTPAPDTFGSMTDSTTSGVTYVGDRWRRADGSINKTNTSWATGSTATKAATTAIELLGYNVSGTNVRGGTAGTTTITTEDKFRDPIWEANGYDLNVVQYRTDKGTGNPKDPAAYTAPLVPAADKFQGYSMGPGYWGKTFFVWPPDPRTPVGNPGDATYKAGDWRQRYFTTTAGAVFTPGGAAAGPGLNQSLLNNGGGLPLAQYTDPATAPWKVDYVAVLKWIKSGPQVLPPNLRAGRLLYYSSIPDDVNSGTGTDQQKLDKVFWKWYIDYVLGSGYYGYYGYYYNQYGWTWTFQYGSADSWAASARSVYQSNLNPWTGPAAGWAAKTPYMRYNDSPGRPRMNFWFGPLSMADFIGRGSLSLSGDGNPNWNPGTGHEAQSWQLKAGMNSVLDNVQQNHPNDSVGMVMFAYTSYKGIRVAQGQDFVSLKNALFYPKSLLTAIKGGDVTTELRPYDLSLNNTTTDDIPNANGGTDPNTGLAFAFNLLSPSVNLPANPYGTLRGRRGASKVVIFETDGVPNSQSSYTFNKSGYNSYYSGFGDGGSPGNGVEPSMSGAVAVATQITKTMATSAGGGVDSGLSLGNAPAKVYPVAFGDLFDPVAAPSATFRPTAQQFLANVGIAGGTLPAGTTALPSYLTVTGSYQTRIDTLRSTMERIFQAGVSVTLIE